jgi:hypothetical protein
MALNANQIADILFKKVAAGKATTEFGRFYGNGEEPYSGRSFVDLSQIWVQSDLIPSVAAEVANVVFKINNIQLTNIPGSSSFTHALLKNVIPFNYGDGSSYAYVLRRNDGTTIIPPGVNDWYLDTETGVLTFFSGDTSTPNAPGTLPTGVTTSSGPYITCYTYIGKTALDTGLSGGGSSIISMGEWQDSVDSLITTLPISPIDGDRYIWNASSGTSAYIINTSTEVVTLGSIDPYDIIEWYEASSGTAGWVSTTATMGMFTSVDSLSNSIYFYNTTSKWTKYESEKTYPTELELVPQNTFAMGTTYDHVISNTQVLVDGTPSTDVTLYVNGVKVKDDSFSLCELTNYGLTYSSSGNITVVSIIFNDTSTLSIGDFVKITASSGTYWRTIVYNDSVTYVEVSGPIISGTISTASVFYISATHSTPIIGDYIIVNDNLGYDIEDDDSVSLEYVRPTV